MPMPNRLDGAMAGWCSVHANPSHVHVSSNHSYPSPPNSTTSLRTMWKAICDPYRAGGELTGSRNAHVLPFQIQVSANLLPKLSSPPNSTTSPLATSYAKPTLARFDGDDSGNAFA